MKYLKFEKLPSCYGIKLAEDLAINDMLKANQQHFDDVFSYQVSLGTFTSVIEPVTQKAVFRVMESIAQEMEKDRGMGKPCKDCEFREGCMASAASFLKNESYWMRGDVRRALE